MPKRVVTVNIIFVTCFFIYTGMFCVQSRSGQGQGLVRNGRHCVRQVAFIIPGLSGLSLALICAIWHDTGLSLVETPALETSRMDWLKFPNLNYMPPLPG